MFAKQRGKVVKWGRSAVGWLHGEARASVQTRARQAGTPTQSASGQTLPPSSPLSTESSPGSQDRRVSPRRKHLTHSRVHRGFNAAECRFLYPAWSTLPTFAYLPTAMMPRGCANLLGELELRCYSAFHSV